MISSYGTSEGNARSIAAPSDEAKRSQRPPGAKPVSESFGFEIFQVPRMLARWTAEEGFKALRPYQTCFPIGTERTVLATIAPSGVKSLTSEEAGSAKRREYIG